MAIDVYKDWLGIPEGPRPPDHYQLLRLVQFEDAVEKVRTNYKKLNAHVRRYATGQYMDESQALLNELAKAMLCLTDMERKREYDVSLGREFEDDATGPRTMDVILIEQKHISAAQAQEAKEYAERTGLDLRDAFVQLKIVEPDLAAQALAQELGLSYVDLTDLHPEDEVLDQVPKKTVRQHSILPLFIDQGTLLVACAHLVEPELEEELRMRFNASVRCVLAAPLAISQAIARHYAPGERNEVTSPSKVAEKPKKGTEKKAADKKAATPPEESKPQKKTLKSPEERKQDFLTGVVVINFSFFVAYLLDAFVIRPNVFFEWETWVLFIVIPGAAAIFAWLKYFKR